LVRRRLGHAGVLGNLRPHTRRAPGEFQGRSVKKIRVSRRNRKVQRYKPERGVDKTYPEASGISCFRFFLSGPEVEAFPRFGTGSVLGPASEAGVFRTRGAGGSPTSAARGVTCSNTWGFRSAETGATEKKNKIKKAEQVPRA
jgi:hypothetical protein